MANRTVQDFVAGCDAVRHSLLQVPEEITGLPWRSGGWTRNEVLGHMIDSPAFDEDPTILAALRAAIGEEQY